MSQTSPSLKRLVYASRPFGFDEGVLRQILGTARRNNARDQITGSLICREDIFLQLLEGPEDEVDATFGRIKNDDRHIEVTELMSHFATKRVFPDWAMRHDPAQSLIWSRSTVLDGAPHSASNTEVMGIFERIASQPTKHPQEQASPHTDRCPHSEN